MALLRDRRELARLRRDALDAEQRRQAGKTVTRRPSDEEARRFQKWVGDRQRLQATLAEMEEVSHKAVPLLVARSARSPRRPTVRSRRSR